MNQKSDGRSPGFTPKQGQYLAFIDACHFVAHFVAHGGGQAYKSLKYWSEGQDSNLRPLRPERSALPG